jgi:pimeloyl-ACP methyl ester carboxylesterase
VGPAGPLALAIVGPLPSAGEGRHEPILFLHPTNLSGCCWLPVARLLSGYPKILLDSRGHGSSHTGGSFLISDHAADVRAVLDALAVGRVHLAGASLGGSIACAVAAADPNRVASLFAVGAALEPADAETLARLDRTLQADSIEQMFAPLLAQEVSSGLARETAAEVSRQLRLDRRSPDLIRRITMSAFSEDARHFAKGVTCPAYVLTGELDASCPPDAGERMAHALGARFEMLPSIGHLAMLQAPQIVADRFLSFLDEVRTS